MSKYLAEFRDPTLAQGLLDEITRYSHTPVRLMEFCGGHTHAIGKAGLRQLLPETVQLLSGPGCPVCVTSSRDLERAMLLAKLPNVILTTFGDMMRVPAASGSLQDARAQGADVRMVYSPLDALQIARENPERSIIWLGVGFETTAPTYSQCWRGSSGGHHRPWPCDHHHRRRFVAISARRIRHGLRRIGVRVIGYPAHHQRAGTHERRGQARRL